jgi:deazaflavin-dependent oxidoreductase (nitroreductase family)
MSTSTRRPSRSQRSGDAIVRLLLRSPVHRMLSSRLLLIRVVGRKTGRTYVHPVGYVEYEGALLIGTAGTWRRNLRPDEPVTIRLRGRDYQADAEVITAEAEAAELYRVILRRNPVHGRFAGIGIDPDGRPNHSDLHRALDNGTAVVRLRPQGHNGADRPRRGSRTTQ